MKELVFNKEKTIVGVGAFSVVIVQTSRTFVSSSNGEGSVIMRWQPGTGPGVASLQPGSTTKESMKGRGGEAGPG